MALARKCDRCGGYFDHMGIGEALMCRFRNPIFQNETGLRENTVQRKLFDDAGPDAYVDLCPNCTTDFLIFMHLSRDENMSLHG